MLKFYTSFRLRSISTRATISKLGCSCDVGTCVRDILMLKKCVRSLEVLTKKKKLKIIGLRRPVRTCLNVSNSFKDHQTKLLKERTTLSYIHTRSDIIQFGPIACKTMKLSIGNALLAVQNITKN